MVVEPTAVEPSGMEVSDRVVESQVDAVSEGGFPPTPAREGLGVVRALVEEFAVVEDPESLVKARDGV